ncbi:acetolactate synthase large subunit [Xylophilus sp. GOD-11R]|uniref:acetolactate synthase large subunit n=1 Tax=Xylophilus sp. GOD-11R TaxID=3089814 RepID=UPI00298C85AB|nr:acetolactate synthase large subunit [Xylophilus sp. GOD-11R]WPB58975.1 acetolactate synthase large subunit [Xylophilus sp. GOD-11R]
MNGAKILVETLLKNGIDTCFANPGTSEMHFVAALDQVPGMKCVLGLQENVVTGMADGYFRIAGKPACTLLHCGPGLANGLANIHNARRARSGMLNIVGDQATYHRPFDAPLTADTESLARAVSAWTRTCTDVARLGEDAAIAAQVATAEPGQIATLILPSDVSWNEGGKIGPVLEAVPASAVVPAHIEKLAQLLESGEPTLLLLSGTALTDAGQDLLRPLIDRYGVSVMAEYPIGRIARGGSRIAIARLPYGIDDAVAVLGKFRHLVLVNANDPVGFFAYPGKPSRMAPDSVEVFHFSRPHQDCIGALKALLGRLGLQARRADGIRQKPEAGAYRGRPTPEALATCIAALMPEDAIVSDESVSFGRGFYKNTFDAAPHDWLHLAGGAIGDGLPVATGAAIAAGRRRRVISVQADGSAMYSIQSLWTQARERLPCTTILLNNRKYQILLGEYAGVGAKPGPTAMSMLDLGNPGIDFVKLAQGMGVEAARATTIEQCEDLMRASFAQDGPFLIELMID